MAADRDAAIVFFFPAPSLPQSLQATTAAAAGRAHQANTCAMLHS